MLNRCIALARSLGMPIYRSRDGHPRNHCSFAPQGGPWPQQGVAGTRGAEFAPTLELPRDTVIIDKATTPGVDAYSAFSDRDCWRAGCAASGSIAAIWRRYHSACAAYWTRVA